MCRLAAMLIPFPPARRSIPPPACAARLLVPVRIEEDHETRDHTHHDERLQKARAAARARHDPLRQEPQRVSRERRRDADRMPGGKRRATEQVVRHHARDRVEHGSMGLGERARRGRPRGARRAEQNDQTESGHPTPPSHATTSPCRSYWRAPAPPARKRGAPRGAGAPPPARAYRTPPPPPPSSSPPP